MIRKHAAGHLRDQLALSSWLEDDCLSDLIELLYNKGILTKGDIAALLGENLLDSSPAPGYGIEIIDDMTQSKAPPRVDGPESEPSLVKPRLIVEESRAVELADAIDDEMDAGSGLPNWNLIAEWAGELHERARWLAENTQQSKTRR